MTAPGSVRVLLCDDSATARGAMARVLATDPAILVVGRVADGRAAIEAVTTLAPDVVLLDLEMPVMDGMTALPLLLRAAPRTAVIVASALTQRGAAAAMAALRAGAADYVPKPSAAQGGMHDPAFREELLAKVKGWARMRAKRAAPVPLARPAVAQPVGPRPRAIGIGSSTGGPQALAALVRRLSPPPRVPMLLVQHMPEGFTTMLADHLNRLGGPPTAEARDGEPLLPGRLYVAPGDHHLLAERDHAGGLVARITQGPPENFCRPAVDPMLKSLLKACDGRLLAVILTGMGQDGLVGCRAVAAAGGTVIAQDEASSVVWGMPGAVARAGLPALLAPPEALADRMMALCAGEAAPGVRAALRA
ncbi:chemotaxis-specific protein-glutamate methyltransferase CheB [Humitalea sp. 24SJ18S-53]|uniref:chemotaxis-specific protein-glutamate methyltransferase CheB n=1 Tax=Humitalea sp. 24SJ18S-53 TaxID=3422307 RepID=UPI003D676E56